MISIEEKFALVVDNYAEHERTLLDLTLSRMLDVDFGYSTVHDGRHLVNRRLANLMDRCSDVRRPGRQGCQGSPRQRGCGARNRSRPESRIRQ